MSDKPSYLGLLNALSLAETNAYRYLSEWGKQITDPDVRRVVLTVAAREGEHGLAFAKRINELGFELKEKPDEGFDKQLEIVTSSRTDLEKMEALGLGQEKSSAEPDVFDNFFRDHSIDIRTGELLGRYIAEERDSGRMLRECHGLLRQAADAEAAASRPDGKADKADKADKVARATAQRLTAIEAKMDQLCSAIDSLSKVVSADLVSVD
jgi:rubrerythrin